MRFLKRSFLFLLITAMVVAAAPLNITRADTGVIYQTSTKETVTSGATLEKITRFTNDGWLNINVLHVDLSNPYIKVDTLSDPEQIKYLNSTKTLAEIWGAAAAMNGGFFNWIEGGGYADGPVVESGKIISADNEYNRYNDSMGTMSITQLNQLLYDYWKTDITLTAPNGTSTVVMQYNKPSKQQYTDFTVMDRRWSSTSVGNIFNDILEMVIEDGKVKEIRQNQPALPVPENGYIVITRQQGAAFLLNNFKVGDPVKMDITTNPDWQNMKTAITGSAILVKEGAIPGKFSFDINGKQPRSIIGSSKDGKQLFLVTVDGRQNTSIGMTQTEAAQLMLELGAYNALNLDGGGSTTMVSRDPGTTNLEIVNKPSDGMARGVSTAVGVFSIAPPSPLDGFIIEAEDTNLFVNTSRDFTVKGFDRYFNPLTVDPSHIQWSVKGVEGTFIGNRFYPKSVGEGKIVATLGNVSSEIDISVLSSPVELTLSDKLVQLVPGQAKTFAVTGKNKYGYQAVIHPQDVNWSVNGNVGTFENGIFIATHQGVGYIDAAVETAHAYCRVSAGDVKEYMKDDFEAANGSFISYPTTVKGNYEISKDQKYAGRSSGKLSYDFTQTEGTRAAYLAFSNEGIKINAEMSVIKMQVYNNHPNSNWLRADITDANGKKQLIDFTKTLDWSGWKSLQASLEGIALPATLNRIYLVQISPVSDEGSIYIDNLSFLSYSGFPAIDGVNIPQDTAYVDEANISTEYVKDENSFQFTVLGQSKPAKNLLKKVLLASFTDTSNKYMEGAIFLGPGEHENTAKLKVPALATHTGYKSFDIKGSRFIQLDISSGSLRTSSANQWQWLLQQLDSTQGNNVFLFMASSPQSLTDSMEADLFQQVLTDYRKKTGRNVWVFYKGDKNSSYMEQGIKYITTAGLDAEGLSPDHLDAGKSLVVTVRGSKVIFEFKPIV